MPGSISPTEKNPSTQDNSSSTNRESETSHPQELTLTDKLNKRLLVSYLERLNNESKEGEDLSNNETNRQ